MHNTDNMRDGFKQSSADMQDYVQLKLHKQISIFAAASESERGFNFPQETRQLSIYRLYCALKVCVCVCAASAAGFFCDKTSC